MLIVYDEHGGIFDHVKPVRLPSPDNLSSIAPPFDFTVSGVRVPAVVISPYIAPGTISSTVFDHTSVIATALKLFAPATWPSDNLFSRAEAANTFDTLLDLNMVPNDAWPNFARPVYGGIVPQIQAATAGAAPLSDLQKEHLDHALNLNKQLPDNAKVAVPPGVDQVVAVAGAFVQAVGNAAIAAHQQVKS